MAFSPFFPLSHNNITASRVSYYPFCLLVVIFFPALTHLEFSIHNINDTIGVPLKGTGTEAYEASKEAKIHSHGKEKKETVKSFIKNGNGRSISISRMKKLAFEKKKLNRPILSETHSILTACQLL